NESIMALIQQLGNINVNQNVPQGNSNFGQNNNNQRPRQPRGPMTCYKCRQPGHMVRNYPTNQQIQQPANNMNANPVPVVQTFAQQLPPQPMNIQPQMQPQYPPMAQAQVFPQPVGLVNTPQNNNVPLQQNNTGGNVFV